MKKRIISLMLIFTMLFSLQITASAAEPSYAKEVTAYYTKYFSQTIPQNLSASFKHKGSYSYLDDHLQISFDEVEKAVSYDIMVSEDKSSEEYKIYNVSGNFMMLDADEFPTGCANGYSVKVRARYGEYWAGFWSEPVTVGCNKLHI